MSEASGALQPAVSKAVTDALQVLQETLEQVDPKVPEGVAPWTIDAWVELSQAWVGWQMLAGYFGVELPEDAEAEAATETDAPKRTTRGRGHERRTP